MKPPPPEEFPKKVRDNEKVLDEADQFECFVARNCETFLRRHLALPDSPAAAEEARKVIAHYYAATTFMDRWVGHLLDVVEELGLADDTLVIYTSDHGEMLYHHGLRDKFVFFEESVRVPFIARLPGVVQPGSTTAALTSPASVGPVAARGAVPRCALFRRAEGAGSGGRARQRCARPWRG